jgi:hypothetical protein
MEAGKMGKLRISLFRRNNGIYYILDRRGNSDKWKSTKTKRKAIESQAVTLAASLLASLQHHII